MEMMMPIDYSKYPSNWLSEIRPAILKRADNKCELCGISNYAIRSSPARPGRKTKIVLTIAHLDHNKDNNDHCNLSALCQKCHLDWDKEQHKESRKKKQLRFFNE